MTVSPRLTRTHLPGRARPGIQYEIREVTIPPGTSKHDVQRRLAEAAEYDRWELMRTRLYVGGKRKVWLRRKTMKLSSTLV